MVFSPFHWVPSSLAALLTFALMFKGYGKAHRSLVAAIILPALLGLAGYLSTWSFRFFPIDFHTLHVWMGLSTLMLSIFLFFDRIILHKMAATRHCYLGKLVALLAAITLLMGVSAIKNLQ